MDIDIGRGVYDLNKAMLFKHIIELYGSEIFLLILKFKSPNSVCSLVQLRSQETNQSNTSNEIVSVISPEPCFSNHYEVNFFCVTNQQKQQTNLFHV